MPSVESSSLSTTDKNQFTLSVAYNALNQSKEQSALFNHYSDNDELPLTNSAQNGYGDLVSASTVVHTDDKPVLFHNAQNGYEESFTPQNEPLTVITNQNEYDESYAPQNEPLTGITNQNENNECLEMQPALSEYNIAPTTFGTQNKNDEDFWTTTYYDINDGSSPINVYPNNYKNLNLPSDSSVEYTETSTSHTAQSTYDKHYSPPENKIEQIQSASLYTISLDSTLESTQPNSINYTLPSLPSNMNNDSFCNAVSVRSEIENNIYINDESRQISTNTVS